MESKVNQVLSEMNLDQNKKSGSRTMPKPRINKQIAAFVKQGIQRPQALSLVKQSLQKSLREFGGAAVHTIRQHYYPSAGALSTGGVGSGYTPATGTIAYSTTDIFFSLYFQAGDLPQISSFSALFDQYRIEEVKVHFFPVFNQSAQLASPDYADLVMVVKDYDDATVPTTRGQILEYEDIVVKWMYNPFTVQLKPRAAVAAYNGSFSAYTNVKAPWIDLATTNTQHYGLKGHFGATSAGGCYWRVVCEMAISFRCIR